MRRFPATMGQRDSNEASIVTALQKVGVTVEQIPTGGGVPDLLCGYNGINYLMEVKPEPIKGVIFASNVQLNAKQELWHSTWKGACAVVRTPEEALEILGLRINHGKM